MSGWNFSCVWQRGMQIAKYIIGSLNTDLLCDTIFHTEPILWFPFLNDMLWLLSLINALFWVFIILCDHICFILPEGEWVRVLSRSSIYISDFPPALPDFNLIFSSYWYCDWYMNHHADIAIDIDIAIFFWSLAATYIMYMPKRHICYQHDQTTAKSLGNINALIPPARDLCSDTNPRVLKGVQSPEAKPNLYSTEYES